MTADHMLKALQTDLGTDLPGISGGRLATRQRLSAQPLLMRHYPNDQHGTSTVAAYVLQRDARGPCCRSASRLSMSKVPRSPITKQPHTAILPGLSVPHEILALPSSVKSQQA